MSEYIVDVGDVDELHFAAFQKTAEFCCGYPVREEVVRCRDCKNFIADELGEVCGLFEFEMVDGRMARGFCAWGK